MDATNSALPKLPREAKNLIIGGMNDNTVLGGVRATSGAGFAAANVIGIGINGTDAIDELKKKKAASLVRCFLALTRKATGRPNTCSIGSPRGRAAQVHRYG